MRMPDIQCPTPPPEASGSLSPLILTEPNKANTRTLRGGTSCLDPFFPLGSFFAPLTSLTVPQNSRARNIPLALPLEHSNVASLVAKTFAPAVAVDCSARY